MTQGLVVLRVIEELKLTVDRGAGREGDFLREKLVFERIKIAVFVYIGYQWISGWIVKFDIPAIFSGLCDLDGDGRVIRKDGVADEEIERTGEADGGPGLAFKHAEWAGLFENAGVKIGRPAVVEVLYGDGKA